MDGETHRAHNSPRYAVIPAKAQVTQIRYTRSGQTESVTDANGNTTRFTYDLNDRQSAVIAPPALDLVTRYTYDTLAGWTP